MSWTHELSWTRERARLAGLYHYRTPDDPELQDARQRLKAALLEDHVIKAVESYPPLTPEQLDLISAALHRAKRASGGEPV